MQILSVEYLKNILNKIENTDFEIQEDPKNGYQILQQINDPEIQYYGSLIKPLHLPKNTFWWQIHFNINGNKKVDTIEVNMQPLSLTVMERKLKELTLDWIKKTGILNANTINNEA